VEDPLGRARAQIGLSARKRQNIFRSLTEDQWVAIADWALENAQDLSERAPKAKKSKKKGIDSGDDNGGKK